MFILLAFVLSHQPVHDHEFNLINRKDKPTCEGLYISAWFAAKLTSRIADYLFTATEKLQNRTSSSEEVLW